MTQIEQIRAGSETAWQDLIEQYEGRLLSYIDQRIHDRNTSEDLVQETLIGFLTSLPHFDPARSIESYLFTIAAHKLTDHFRRTGRRPMLSMTSHDSSTTQPDWPSHERGASTLLRSSERREAEATALTEVLRQIIDKWRSNGDWPKIQAAERLFVCGESNKQVAASLNWSEQQVANFKHDLIERMQKHLRSQQLDPHVFPELA
jgi:RNA polymerase sigma-70 factor, ECF subfamily